MTNLDIDKIEEDFYEADGPMAVAIRRLCEELREVRLDVTSARKDRDREWSRAGLTQRRLTRALSLMKSAYSLLLTANYEAAKGVLEDALADSEIVGPE